MDDGTKFVQAVPMARRAWIKPGFPKSKPVVTLFDPEKVPSLGLSLFPDPQKETDRNAAQRLLPIGNPAQGFGLAPVLSSIAE
jgi:hypothetical protein